MAWVQIVGFEETVPLATARSDPTAGQWKALQNMAGTHARIRDESVRARLETLLLDTNPIAADRWAKWQRGAPYPRDLYPDEPQREVWEPPPAGTRSSDHEVFLQRVIRRFLLRNGWREHDAATDGFELPKSNVLTLASGARGYADIILVHQRRRRHLLVVEVKKHAVPTPWRNGLDQLEDYGCALRRRAPGWTIERWLVAKTVDPTILKQARSLEIDCYEWRGRPPGFRQLRASRI